MSSTAPAADAAPAAGESESGKPEVRKRILSGVQPTGNLHLGNYLGAIRPALSLVEEYQTLYFIADYHALTSVRDADALRG